jgi:hypothetical protein
MSSRVRVIKKDRNNVSKQPPNTSATKSERQRHRELVAVVKSWIEELELRRRSIPAATAVSSR